MERNISGKKERTDGSFYIYFPINCCLSYLFIYLFYFQPFVVRYRVKSLLFLWDGRLKISLIANGEEYHWKKERTDGSCYIYFHCLLLILLIYLLIYFIYFIPWSLIREIVVVSLRWSFKNPSDHWKKRKKEQMVPPMNIPYQLLLILLTYLFYSVIVREIVIVSLRWFKNPSDRQWRRTSLERKNRWFLPCIFPLLFILFIYLLTYFISWSREIVVVSLRWPFKNPSNYWKKRKEEQMIPAMYIPISIVAYSTYLLTYLLILFHDRRVKLSLFLWDGPLKIPLITNGEEYHWKKRKNRWLMPCIFPLLFILFTYLLIYFIPWLFIVAWNRRCFFEMV